MGWPFVGRAVPRRSVSFDGRGGYFLRGARVCDSTEGAAAITLGLIVLGLRTSRLPLDKDVPFEDGDGHGRATRAKPKTDGFQEGAGRA